MNLMTFVLGDGLKISVQYNRFEMKKRQVHKTIWYFAPCTTNI